MCCFLFVFVLFLSPKVKYVPKCDRNTMKLPTFYPTTNCREENTGWVNLRVTAVTGGWVHW